MSRTARPRTTGRVAGRTAAALVASAVLLLAGCSATTSSPGPSRSAPGSVPVPAADAPGVTDDTIRLGYLGYPEYNEENQRAVDQMGLEWPGGRRLELVPVAPPDFDGPYDPLLTQAVCESVKQLDQPIFAMQFNLPSSSLSECLSDQDVLLVLAARQVDPEVLLPHELALSLSPPAGPVVDAVVQDLRDRGWFDQDDSVVALFPAESTDDPVTRLQRDRMVDALTDAGARGARAVDVDEADAGSLSSVLLELKADGVEHVVCWVCGADAFLQAADQQRYDPAFADWEGSNALVPFELQPDGWGQGRRDTFVGYSTHPVWTLPQMQDLIAGDPRAQRCADALAQGLEGAGVEIAVQLERVCMVPALLSAALASAPPGSGVNPQAAVAGLRAATDAGEPFSWPTSGELRFTPEESAGGTSLFVTTADPTCGCLLTADDPLSLDG